MRARGAIWSAALLALALAPPARAQSGADSAPVPPGWLDGAKIVLEPAGCSIEAPERDWIWLAPKTALPPGLLLVFCESPDGKDRFRLQIDADSHGKLTGDWVEQFLIRYEQPRGEQGYKVDKIKYHPSELPIEGRSYWFQDELLDATGKRFYSRGYMTMTRRLYVLSSFSPEEKAPSSFQKFAGSFRLLARPQNAPGEPVFGQKSFALVVAIMVGAALLLVVAMLAFVIAWRRRAREEAQGEAPPAP